MIRTYLFVPADRPDRFDKALAAGAGAVIIDLEDAVAPGGKEGARESMVRWLAGTDRGDRVLVRINGAETPWFADDLAACAGSSAVAGVVLPKAARREAIHRVAAAGKRVYPLIESAAGFDAVRDVASQAGVKRLMFGSIDFQIDLGIGSEDGLLAFRSGIVLASRLAGLPPPVDGVTPSIDDEQAIVADALRAKHLGFGAKLCIHPRQVAIVERTFAPTQADRQWAQRVLDAVAAAGGGAVAVDGQMVDTPIILRARAILAYEKTAG